VRKSVYERGKERQNSRITRPKVLLVVGHPSVGSALETLLRIEDRYEVRRVQSLADSGVDRDQWTPDVALVDGVLLGSTSVAALPVPTIVLSGNEADGARLLTRVPDGRAWLRKDATAADLREAVDRVIARRPAPARWLPFVVAMLVLVVVIAIFAVAIVRGHL
jgi:DNA-binding NarL/FixJ family response regulator